MDENQVMDFLGGEGAFGSRSSSLFYGTHYGRKMAHFVNEWMFCFLAGRVNAARVVTSVLALLLLCWCLIRLSGQSYNPFIYFRF